MAEAAVAAAWWQRGTDPLGEEGDLYIIIVTIFLII
jgi:hypothetical protein